MPHPINTRSQDFADAEVSRIEVRGKRGERGERGERGRVKVRVRVRRDGNWERKEEERR